MATQTNSIPGSGYGNAYIDSLIWGCGWTGGPVTYSFGTGIVDASRSSIDTGFTGGTWTVAEENAFTTALAQYSAVCNLTFQKAGTQGQANIVWWLAPQSAMGAGSLGLHEVPDQSTSQIYGYFNYQEPSWAYLTPGGDGFVTIIHELGHGMGLAHPHDGGDHLDATRFPGVSGPWSTGTNGLNQGIWTTMSYNDGWTGAPPTSYAYGYQATLMALDVAALQTLYGVNMGTATGSDTYALPTVQGSGTGWSCIWDAGGTDTISNQGSALACTINLNAAPLTGANAGGFISRDAGITGGFTIANGVVIENATGGSGNDTLVGNALANVLDGGQGADRMSGGGGNDTYIVDNVRDVITEAAGGGTDTEQASVSVTLGREVEILVLTGSANLSGIGNGSANTLFGNSGNNVLNGGSGNDILIGGLGVDTLTGGKGSDVFQFQLGDSGVGAGLRDVVTDFRSGDLIDLSLMDANSLLDGVQAFNLIGAAPFSGLGGELRFAAGVLSGDIDGNHVADFEIALTGVRSFTTAMLVH